MIELDSNCLIVTRDKQVYWIHTLGGSDLQAYCLSTDINIGSVMFTCVWDKKTLLCNRTGDHISLGYVSEPREKDIIYVFKITDYPLFLNVIRSINFIQYWHLVNYTRNKFCELIFERIDGQFD